MLGFGVVVDSSRSDAPKRPETAGGHRLRRAHVVAAFEGPGHAPDPAADGYAWLGDKRFPESDPNMTAAAVLVPLIDRHEGMTVLLTQRTAHLKSHAGQVSFPGGRAEDGDGSPENTALRETEEELGMPRRHVDIVGRLNVRETGTGYRVVPIVGLIDPPFRLEPDANEVAEIFEIPLSVVLDPANYRFETRVQRGAERQFYALPYDGFYIWGLTARLLVNLAEVLKR